MDIVTAITAGTKALEALKAISDIDKNLDAATWKGKVADLMCGIADMKLALIEANDKIRDLEKDNEALLNQVRFKAEKTVYEKGLLYEVYEDGKVAEFPFCQHCMTNAKYIRLSRTPKNDVACPGCKMQYNFHAVLYRS